ncbi:hypothetical protein ID849_13825, partial [Xenorhabdus sp. 3]
MIRIDNAQNEMELPKVIDDGCEWADWLLKKADEVRRTQGIPWVSVKDRMPVDGDNYSSLCLVYYTYIGGFSHLINGIGYDYWDSKKEQWKEYENDEVT